MGCGQDLLASNGWAASTPPTHQPTDPRTTTTWRISTVRTSGVITTIVEIVVTIILHGLPDIADRGQLAFVGPGQQREGSTPCRPT